MNLSTKAKIFILIGWTLVLTLITVVVTLIVTPKTVLINANDYKTNPNSEYVNISATLTEVRKSSFNSSNASTLGESSTWNLKVRMLKPKKDISVIAKYLQCLVRVETINGDIIYKEDAKGSLKANGGNALLNSATYTDFTFSSIASRSATNAETIELTTDQTPKNIYITLYYVLHIGTDKVVNEGKLEYKVENLDKVEFSTGSKLDTDVVDIEVEDEGDHLHTHFAADTNILGEEGEIENAVYQVIAKVKNDPRDSKDLTPNYINIATYFGKIDKTLSLLNVANSLDSNYEIEGIYVIGQCKTNSGSYTTTYQYHFE